MISKMTYTQQIIASGLQLCIIVAVLLVINKNGWKNFIKH